MESQTFAVEADKLPEFVDVITDNDLGNEIIGQSGDGRFFVNVDYEKEEEQAVFLLLEFGEPVDDEEDLEDED